jgi:hypothetical protein
VDQYLPFLLFLACPIAMGVMMWMMMRGRRPGGDQSQPPAPPDPRIAELEDQIRELRSALRDRDAPSADTRAPR